MALDNLQTILRDLEALPLRAGKLSLSTADEAKRGGGGGKSNMTVKLELDPI